MKRSIKPFDKVLVRDSDANTWGADFYAYSIGETHFGIGKIPWKQCIPYEGNEYLLGTNDSPEPELKKGDVVLVWKKGDIAKCIRVYMHHDDDLNQHMAYAFLLKDGVTIEAQGWDYAQKFAPAAVEDPAAT